MALGCGKCLKLNGLEEKQDGVLLKREREANTMVEWMMRVVFEDVRVCLVEI